MHTAAWQFGTHVWLVGWRTVCAPMGPCMPIMLRRAPASLTCQEGCVTADTSHSIKTGRAAVVC